MSPKGQERGKENDSNMVAASKLKNESLLTSETGEAGLRGCWRWAGGQGLGRASVIFQVPLKVGLQVELKIGRLFQT